METQTIALEVEADLAQAYREASAKDQSKLQLLLNLWLRELLVQSTSLQGLMDELSDRAQSRGLTSDKLEELLRAS